MLTIEVWLHSFGPESECVKLKLDADCSLQTNNVNTELCGSSAYLNVEQKMVKHPHYLRSHVPRSFRIRLVLGKLYAVVYSKLLNDLSAHRHLLLV